MTDPRGKRQFREQHERITKQKYTSSDSENSWEDLGSRSTDVSANSSHYSGITAPSLGNESYRRTYRERERSLSRSRGPREHPGRFYEHRKPPSYPRPRAASDHYSSDDSFQERTVKTREVHHHHYGPDAATGLVHHVRGDSAQTSPRASHFFPPPRAIANVQYTPSFVPSAPMPPAAQPAYMHQGAQAHGYILDHATYPLSSPRDAAAAYEARRELDGMSEQRRRLDTLRREEFEHLDRIDELRRRGHDVSGGGVGFANSQTGYEYGDARVPAQQRFGYVRPRSMSEEDRFY